MTKIATGILVFVLTAWVRVQATQIYSTLNAGSTPGDFFGGLVLSFDDTSGSASGGSWVSAQTQPTYTVSGASISLSFSSLSEDPNGLTFLSSFTFTDSRIGYAVFTFPLWPAGSSGYFAPGHSGLQNLDYNSGNVPLYDFGNLGPAIGTIDFSYTLPVHFDGTAGSGVGSWSLTYSVSPPVAVPDDGSTLFLLGTALAGLLCLSLVCPALRRAN